MSQTLTTKKTAFKLGFIVNPIAGIGGSVALKGSDGVVKQAQALGATAKANDRAVIALTLLKTYQAELIVYTANSAMGESTAKALGFSTEVVYSTSKQQDEIYETTAVDTEKAVLALIDNKVDLILFAGGDGTARNICDVVERYAHQHDIELSVPVLGIPAGCKIHSGVYAVTPKAAGRIVELMITGQLVSLMNADVMDIDESLFRKGIVKAKRFGEMKIPQELQYVQAVKSGGKELDELVLQDIAANVIEQMDDALFIIGSGSTTAAIMEELGRDNTLLGVDALFDRRLVARDIIEADLLSLIAKHQTNGDAVKLVITIIGGQGHILGRGNQQLSPCVIRAIGKENIIIVATKAKLASLNTRPLIVDTGDSELDLSLIGFLPVVTGYKDQVLYPVASPQ